MSELTDALDLVAVRLHSDDMSEFADVVERSIEEMKALKDQVDTLNFSLDRAIASEAVRAINDATFSNEIDLEDKPLIRVKLIEFLRKVQSDAEHRS